MVSTNQHSTGINGRFYLRKWTETENIGRGKERGGRERKYWRERETENVERVTKNIERERKLKDSERENIKRERESDRTY